MDTNCEIEKLKIEKEKTKNVRILTWLTTDHLKISFEFVW